MSYLQEVITDVLENYPDKIERLVFVTTGKRPALFLKKHFAEQVKQATIAPEFIGIADLFTRISGVQPISNLPLLFEFYDCYVKTCKTTPDSFEEFLSWGQTALKDFSEIDQYLVNPDKIFPYIHALKEVEHWSGMDELSEMQKKHLAFWNSLGDYYFALNSKLTKMGKGYGGFIAKKAVEKLPEYLQTHSNSIHIFVGFNALSKAEQKVIQSMLMDLGGEIYWDGDTYFLNNPAHDAGFFLRKYIKSWRYYQTHKPKFIQSNYEKEKELYLTGVPKSINQAHSVAELLKNTPAKALEKTALIIADENLLIPVLQAVQPKTSMNITMGYPLQQTPLNDLFVAYFRLHLSKSFYYKDILNLLSQPFLHTLLKEEVVRHISQYIKTHNLTY
ncbi:MAG: PD-(D/E)XK nuclease family protein, partial [Capnocytophaga ochracea]